MKKITKERYNQILIYRERTINKLKNLRFKYIKSNETNISDLMRYFYRNDLSNVSVYPIINSKNLDELIEASKPFFYTYKTSTFLMKQKNYDFINLKKSFESLIERYYWMLERNELELKLNRWNQTIFHYNIYK